MFLPTAFTSVDVEPGTRVRVRDEAGQCVGEASWDGAVPATLMVWLDDPETPEKDGAILDEVLSVSVVNGDETKVDPVITDAYGMPEGALPDRVVFYPDAVYVVSGLARVADDSAGGLAGAHRFALNRPFPNPASDAASVSYVLEEAADVQLLVYDAIGRLVLSVDRGREEGGPHTERLNLRMLPAGAYSARLVATGTESVQRASVRFTVSR